MRICSAQFSSGTTAAIPAPIPTSRAILRWLWADFRRTRTFLSPCAMNVLEIQPTRVQPRAINAISSQTRTTTPCFRCKLKRFKPASATSSRNSSARTPTKARSFDCAAFTTWQIQALTISSDGLCKRNLHGLPDCKSRA